MSGYSMKATLNVCSSSAVSGCSAMHASRCITTLPPSYLHIAQAMSELRKRKLHSGTTDLCAICHAHQPNKGQITSQPSTSGRDLAAATSRQQVLISCSVVSAAFAAIAAAIRLATPITSPFIFKSDQSAVQALLQDDVRVQASHALPLLATAAAVTAARSVLLSSAPAFAEATNTSNKQVLTPLTGPDLIWLSCLPGISEELLFRGALIPGTFPDWRGALLSAALFGGLHRGGGRNWTFAAWAGAVGMLYGAVYLATQDLIVPMGAHCLANYASAALWLRNNKSQEG